ncbi:MAG: apolipoprotein N-acyltransferase [Lentimicrobiaceae bacterium]|nr:apolipoprotein N-acyltransferase [Lentimicrobiaceae bacterium]
MSLLKNKLFLSLLSGVLLWLSWYPHGCTVLIFIAFVPLFFVSDKLHERGKGWAFWQGVGFSFPAFLIWNVGVTWWIWNSTPPGSVAAILLNSFFMCCVFGMWHWVKKMSLHIVAISLAFIAFWCSWEFLHLQWQLTWTWLNLGNVFATHPLIVQWYEYTGAFGGTIWILTVNFICYALFKQFKPCFDEKKSMPISSILRHLFAHKIFIMLIAVILIPLLASLIIYKTYTIKQTTPIEALIVQQNIDAWTEQYEKSNFELAEVIIETAKTKLTPSTVLMVCPESALSHSIFEEQLYHLDQYPHGAFEQFDALLQDHPRLNLILGLSTRAVFNYKASPTAREYSDSVFIEHYNTSALYHDRKLQLYHKSKLVPGVEKMPYPKIFGFLEKLAIDLGGTSGSLGVDSEQRVFHVTSKEGVVKIGAPICYESIFGALFSQFVKNGAQLMCVITNDAWWGNTAGHKQHFEMSKLRAIETRRYILRAANTGISAFIDPLGKAYQKTEYEVRTAITQMVYPNEKLTFYTKHGDYLARIMLGVAALMVLWRIISLFRPKSLTTNH